MSEKNIYIILRRESDVVTGHALKTGEIDQKFVDSIFIESVEEDEEVATNSEKIDGEKSSSIPPYPESFLDVERAFSQAMLMYRNSVIETIRIAPILADITLGVNVDGIAKSRGAKVEALSSESIEVYSLPEHTVYSIIKLQKSTDALREGALHLPKISTIGIISSYDAILTDLLRVIFTMKPETIFTSDREIKFSDLITLGSIDAARDSIINNEIEGVVRQSHHEQFLWMERKFGMKLTEGLGVWPDFIELCERRNLLTHTGGVVSEQYIKNCTRFGRKPVYKVGDKLNVDLDYLNESIRIVSEVGYKLIHTMWRKFAPDERSRADNALNSIGMDLINAREYNLAERILDFGTHQKAHSSEKILRMMVVNLANAAKLGGSKGRSDKALSAHDWSATSYQFQICVAAVRSDYTEVHRLLMLGGDVIEISPSDFRDWPVFKDARKNSSVQEAFEKVFGEPLVKSESVTSQPATSLETSTEEDVTNELSTIH